MKTVEALFMARQEVRVLRLGEELKREGKRRDVPETNVRKDAWGEPLREGVFRTEETYLRPGEENWYEDLLIEVIDKRAEVEMNRVDLTVFKNKVKSGAYEHRERTG